MTSKKYYEHDYALFWKNQSYLYGITSVEQYIMGIIEKAAPKKVFEIAIGNGYPYAVSLAGKGINVSGCDLSSISLETARENISNSGGEMSDVFRCDAINIPTGKKFDCVYCIRSSWYMTSFLDVIRKMFELAGKDGIIIFDIMDKRCQRYKKDVIQHSFADFVLRLLRYPYEPHRPVYYDSRKVDRFITALGGFFEKYSEAEIEGVSDSVNSKVLYVCRKKAVL